MKKIAIIGTGIMGSGMALNFLKKGYTVYVWNRTKDNAENLVAQGAILTTTPKEATEKADMVFEVTANDESSKSVWFGEKGIISGATKDKILIASSTLSVRWIDELIEECVKRSLIFFDMPLTGGRSGAETGTLTLLIGGDRETIEKIKPELDAISNKQRFFGKAGSGTRFKLILNMLAGIHMVGFGEALKLAEANELDLKTVGDALAEQPGGTTTNLTWRDHQNNHQSLNFAVKWIVKDLEYAKEFGMNVETPLLDDVLKKYKEALDKGKGEKNWTVVNTV
ncbi:MAG TPA: NAD(P)-dependent oxidoreductase [Candidatus Paceibacterota bacterium]|nr:NAD(P)-dependent oxidoreductase [Candidatus Paceibacterota bacterium]